MTESNPEELWEEIATLNYEINTTRDASALEYLIAERERKKSLLAKMLGGGASA